MRQQFVTSVLCSLAALSIAGGQTKPTQAEIDRWKGDPKGQVLETSPCKKITWLLEGEKASQRSGIHTSLAWWGRGFIEGAVFMIPGEAAAKKADEFGLSADVVASHISSYCYDHPDKTPMDAIQALLLLVLK